jgi:hypothetical protein
MERAIERLKSEHEHQEMRQSEEKDGWRTPGDLESVESSFAQRARRRGLKQIWDGWETASMCRT